MGRGLLVDGQLFKAHGQLFKALLLLLYFTLSVEDDPISVISCAATTMYGRVERKEFEIAR